MNQALYLVIGLAAGVLAGMFGIGGGILVVPALILLAKFTPQMATGTSLAIFLFPVGLFGAWAYYKEGNVRMVPALLLALGILFGSPVGARIAQQMSASMLRRSFAVFLVIVATRLWFGKA
ncbi:MAG: sulfite exporter TauE/SafE family protein [Gemmatimonadaceae bacterium]